MTLAEDDSQQQTTSITSSNSDSAHAVAEGDGGVCQYDYKAARCTHTAGYDDSREGIFAAAATGLGTVMPLVLDAIRSRYGLPASFAACAVTMLSSSALATWSLWNDVFSTMIVARMIYGGTGYAMMGMAILFAELGSPEATSACSTVINLCINMMLLWLDAYGVFAPLVSSNYLTVLEGLHCIQWFASIAVAVFVPFASDVLSRRPLPPPPAVVAQPKAPGDACAVRPDGGAQSGPIIEMSEAAAQSNDMKGGGLGTRVHSMCDRWDSSAAASTAAMSPCASMADFSAVASPNASPIHPRADRFPPTSTAAMAVPQGGEATLPESPLASTSCVTGRVAGPPPPPPPALSTVLTPHAATCSTTATVGAVVSTPSTAVAAIPTVAAPEIVATSCNPAASGLSAADCSSGVAEDDDDDEGKSELFLLLTKYRMPLFRSALLSALDNLSGLPAVCNFAPILLESSGYDPMVGNMLCGAAFVVGAIISVPAERVLPIKLRAYSCGYLMTAAAFLVGVALLPAIDSGFLTIVGLAGWILAFSGLFGPVYYYCGVKFFPPRVQATASAVTQMFSSLWGLLVNATFPSFVTMLSGGAGGDKRIGRGRAFLVFACSGLVLSTALLKVFKTWDEVVREKNAARERCNDKQTDPEADSVVPTTR
jgi:hypothetical protein